MNFKRSRAVTQWRRAFSQGARVIGALDRFSSASTERNIRPFGIKNTSS